MYHLEKGNLLRYKIKANMYIEGFVRQLSSSSLRKLMFFITVNFYFGVTHHLSFSNFLSSFRLGGTQTVIGLSQFHILILHFLPSSNLPEDLCTEPKFPYIL